jgi:iron complex transport system substrate-binding protein
VRAARSDVLVIACCGFDVARTLDDLPLLREAPGWSDLPAVQQGDVWVLDGCAYVSRPGPRLADTVEIVAQCLHPQTFGDPNPTQAVRVA